MKNLCLTISAEKCELLKINSKCNGENLIVNNEKMKLVNVAKYLGDSFSSKGSDADLCKDRVDRTRGLSVQHMNFLPCIGKQCLGLNKLKQ